MEVLHTWGQTLVYHPHIHAIVPGGLFDLCTSVQSFGTGYSYGGLFQGCTLLETIPADLFAWTIL